MFRFWGPFREVRSVDKRQSKYDHQTKKSDPSTALRIDTARCDEKPRESFAKMTNLDNFLETMSVETSIYTSPSMPTLQHPHQRGRASGNVEWYSSQGSGAFGPGTTFTAEFALAQYRLGGWQSDASIESEYVESEYVPSDYSLSYFTLPSTRCQNRGNEIFCSDGVHTTSFCNDVSPTSSTLSLQAVVDSSKLSNVKAEEPPFDEQSTASSDVSWCLDNEAYNEKIAQTTNATTYRNETTFVSETLDGIYSSREEEEYAYSKKCNSGKNDGDSACSTVSSLTMYNFGYRGCQPEASTLPPSSSHIPPKRDTKTLRSVEMPTTYHAKQVPTAEEIDSKVDDSDYHDNESVLSNLHFGNQVSFSGLISRCEAESLAQRLAPDYVSPTRKMIGRTINTNALDTKSCQISLDASHTTLEPIKSLAIQPSKAHSSTPKEKESPSFVTPKINNTQLSLSTYDHMVPNPHSVDPSAASVPAASVTGSTEFYEIRSKFEIQSLKYRMEPPTPRRLTGQTFEGMNKGEKGEEISECSIDEECQSVHQQGHHTTEPTESADPDTRPVAKGTSLLSSSPSWSEEKSIQNVSESVRCEENAEASHSVAPQKSEDEVTNSSASSSFHKREVKCINSEMLDEVARMEEQSLDPSENLSRNKSQVQNESDSEGKCSDKCSLSISNRSHKTPLTSDKGKLNKPKSNRWAYTGPVDLDESICDSLSCSMKEEDTQIPSTSGDNEEECKAHTHSENDSDGSLTFANERTSKEYMDFLRGDQASNQDDSPGSLRLSEHELKRHMTSIKIQSCISNTRLPGYDEWKTEQEAKRCYFEKLQDEINQQMQEHDELRLCSKTDETRQPLDDSKMTMDIYPERTIHVVKDLQVSTRKKKSHLWKLFSGMLHRHDGHVSFAKKHKRGKDRSEQKQDAELNDKKGVTPSDTPTISIDKFIQASRCKISVETGDNSDLSLLPLRKLGQLTNCSGHDGAREIFLKHLELERQKQWQAEIDKAKNEWHEQIRISILKEEELEKQRRVNTTKADRTTHRIASEGVGFPDHKTNLDNMVTRVYPGPKLGNLLGSGKTSPEGCLYSSTPIKYLRDKSRVTNSTSKETESFESCSVNSFLHASLSFDSVQSPSAPITSKPTSRIGPCIVCKVSERTHISMPCMHYSFCADCAEELHELKNPTCPICQTNDIVLTRVYT